jgi:hypothetical protein
MSQEERAALPGAWLKATLVALLAFLLLVPPAQAQENQPEKILKAMSEYLASQKTISATLNTDIEVVTPELQNIQFASSGRVQLSRPDKIRASRRGGYADVDFVSDGKTLTVLGKNLNVFTQLEAAGSVDQLIQRLRNEFSMDAPGAVLLTSRAYDELMQSVVDSKYIGHGVIDGVDTEHLAFRAHDVDWQIWIEIGPRPIPRKLVITSKAVTGAPQYTLRISDWSTDPVAADTFVFKAPANAKKVDVGAFPHIDEVPQGTVPGGKR